jgi:cytoskeleton protein RodZ
MTGLGEQIAAAREKRGITAQEAAQRLHIRSQYIVAIEAEDWAKLGAPAYARGFVRNYARMVGIDQHVVAEQLDAAVPMQPPTTDTIAPPDADTSERSTSIEAHEMERSNLFERNGHVGRVNSTAPATRAWYPWLLGLMSTLAAALVIAVLYYTFGPAPRPQSQAAPVVNQTDASIASPAPQDAAVFNAASAGATDAGLRPGVNLQLQLTQDSWLSVTVDGKRVVYETLPAGTVRAFHGVREISLRAGNAGGVNATIDGRSLGTLGQHGQVEERVFAAKTSSQLTTGPRE